jgi:hypothetical protein
LVVGRGAAVFNAPRFTTQVPPARPVRKSRPASIAPGQSHRPNAGSTGVIPRGETMGTLEEKLFSVYDANTALIQTGRQCYI